MSISELNLEKIGFWGILFIYIVRDGVIPIASKYFPSKMKLSEREQDRADNRMAFEQQMELRHVEALEGIKEIVTVMNERLLKIEGKIEKCPIPRKKAVLGQPADERFVRAI